MTFNVIDLLLVLLVVLSILSGYRRGFILGVFDLASWVLSLLAGAGQHRLRICLRVADQVPRTVTLMALPSALVAWAEPAAGLGPSRACAKYGETL